MKVYDFIQDLCQYPPDMEVKFSVSGSYVPAEICLTDEEVNVRFTDIEADDCDSIELRGKCYIDIMLEGK